MDLDKLKTDWQQAAGETEMNQAQLEQMTRVNNHPVLGKIRIKLLIEAVAITALLFVFYDIFDGHDKPVYASVMLVLGALFYLSSNLYSYFTLKHPVGSGNLLSSLQHYFAQLQRARAFSLVSLVLFSVSLWVFFSSSVALDAKRLWMLAGMGGLTLVFLYLSARTWTHWISRIRHSIDVVEE